MASPHFFLCNNHPYFLHPNRTPALCRYLPSSTKLQASGEQMLLPPHARQTLALMIISQLEHNAPLPTALGMDV